MAVIRHGSSHEVTVRGHGRTMKEAETWIRKYYSIIPKDANIKLKLVYQDKEFGFFEGKARWNKP